MIVTILGLLLLVYLLIHITKGKPARVQNGVEEVADQGYKERIREIRRKIDLHYERSDFSQNKNYVEFSFHAPFGEVFNIDEQEPIKELKGDELFNVLDTLNIVYDSQLIFDKYMDEANQSVEVFHSTEDAQVFAYFDLQKDSTDQNGMFFLGISCRREDERRVHEMLLHIYRKLNTSSAFNFDIGGKGLYNKTFFSYTYFYGQNYNEHKAQMHHHNLQ